MRRRNQLILTLLKVSIAAFLFMKSLDRMRSRKTRKSGTIPNQLLRVILENDWLSLKYNGSDFDMVNGDFNLGAIS